MHTIAAILSIKVSSIIDSEVSLECIEIKYKTAKIKIELSLEINIAF